jgi:G3E family GTPase
MEFKTPITLITGPLGSGKTTLLSRILSLTSLRLAVVMNEFGELSVDSRVIKGKNIQYVELAGGCVCCSLAGELDAAVRELVDTVSPEWILLEATGVAEADALVYTVEESLPIVRLDCVVCIVDAYAAIHYPSMGYAERSQLESADLVVINKTDLVSPEELARVRAKISPVAGGVLEVETVRSEVDMSLLFGPDAVRNPSRRVPDRHPGHHAGIQAFAASMDTPLDRAAFVEFLSGLPPEVFRSKGFVRFVGEGEWVYNYVAGRIDFEEHTAPRTEMVFIGPRVEGVREKILKSLTACGR